MKLTDVLTKDNVDRFSKNKNRKPNERGFPFGVDNWERVKDILGPSDQMIRFVDQYLPFTHTDNPNTYEVAYELLLEMMYNLGRHELEKLAATSNDAAYNKVLLGKWFSDMQALVERPDIKDSIISTAEKVVEISQRYLAESARIGYPQKIDDSWRARESKRSKEIGGALGNLPPNLPKVRDGYNPY